MQFKTTYSHHDTIFQAVVFRMQAVENIFGNLDILKLGFIILSSSQVAIKALGNDEIDFKMMFSYLCTVFLFWALRYSQTGLYHTF